MGKKARATKPRKSQTSAPEASGETAGLSSGRKRLFWALTLLIPVLFFVLLEVGLRIGGYGESYPMFEQADGYSDIRVQNKLVAKRYFSAIADVPNANADFFYADKPEDSFRIFAQGGSSAAGFPYYWGAAFPRVMANQLRASYPGERVDVVNTSMAAVNSYTLLDLADEIVEQQPDAVVIYAGHNEFYGALGAASAERFGSSPALIRTYLALRDFRTVQLVRNIIAGFQRAAAERRAGERPSTTLMSRMVGEQSVPIDSEVFEAGHEQFRDNLDRLLATYQAAGVPVFIGTLASNERDQRPFVTVHASGADTTAYDDALQEGLALFARGDSTAATSVFQRAIDASVNAAEGHYRLGQALLGAGEIDAARDAFIRAKDLDALRFRAPEAFNNIIREVADARGATVVESEASVRAASENGIVGFETMLEHLHPTLRGYDAIADAFSRSIVASGLIAPEALPAPPPRVVRLATPVDSLVGAIRVAKLTQEWPFRPGEARPFSLDTTQTPLAVYRIAEDLASDAVAWATATDALADLYLDLGRPQEALRARQAMLMMYWYEPRVHVALGGMRMRLAQETGDAQYVDLAAQNYEAAVARDAQNGPALSMLGAIHVQRSERYKASGDETAASQQREQAIAYLERARRALPQDTQVLYNLAGAYALQSQWQDALRAVDLLLQQQPQNGAARQLRASVLANLNRPGA